MSDNTLTCPRCGVTVTSKDPMDAISVYVRHECVTHDLALFRSVLMKLVEAGGQRSAGRR